MCALREGRLLQFLFNEERSMRRRPDKAFTLMELMVAVMIVAILSTMAAVTYVRVYEKAKGDQAIATLRMIRAAERVYWTDWNAYADLPFGTCASFLITQGYLQCPNTPGSPFDYEIAVLGATHGATAVRRAGRYGGKTIILTVTCCPEAPTWTGTWPWPPS